MSDISLTPENVNNLLNVVEKIVERRKSEGTDVSDLRNRLYKIYYFGMTGEELSRKYNEMYAYNEVHTGNKNYTGTYKIPVLYPKEEFHFTKTFWDGEKFVEVTNTDADTFKIPGSKPFGNFSPCG